MSNFVNGEFIYFPNFDWHNMKCVTKLEFNKLPILSDKDSCIDAVKQAYRDIENNSIFIPMSGGPDLTIPIELQAACNILNMEVIFVTSCETYTCWELWISVYKAITNKYIKGEFDDYEFYSLDELVSKLKLDYKNLK
jgi:hypothetical protein